MNRMARSTQETRVLVIKVRARTSDATSEAQFKELLVEAAQAVESMGGDVQAAVVLPEAAWPKST